MTLTENFIRETIHLYGNAEVMFGSDEMYDTYPCYIPTVEFMLVATDALAEVADRIRMEKGFLPTHPRDGRTDEVDNDAWYDFYIGICRLPGENQPCQLDSSITFTVVNSDADDNECMYGIELTADEQSVVLDILNSQCRKYMNKTCDELLNEAEEEMMDTE